MQVVAFEKLNGLERKLKVNVEVEKVTEAYQKHLQKVAAKANIKGFRPGKVPLNVVERQFGQRVLSEVADDLLRSSLTEAIAEKEIRMAGAPAIENIKLKKDEPLEYEAVFEVYPEITVKDLEAETVEQVEAEVSDQDVTESIDKLRQQQAAWNEVEEAAKNEDRININFEGSIDGELFEGGKAEDFYLVLGSGQMIPGFEDQLVGLKKGDEKTISVTFPEDYRATELAGKPAEFKIVVNKVEVATLPELNDDFAKRVGIEEGLDKLKETVLNNLADQLKNAVITRNKTLALEKLLELNPIEVPQALINAEVDHLQAMTKQRIAQQYQQPIEKLEKMDLPKDPYIKEATKRVKVGLLLSEIIKAYEIKADADAINNKIEELASAYPNPEEIKQLYHKHQQLMAEVEAALLEEAAVTKLLEKAKVKSTSQSYQDVMNAMTEGGSDDSE